MNCPECTYEADTPSEIEAIVKYEMCLACCVAASIPEEPIPLTPREIKYGEQVAERRRNNDQENY